MKVAWIVPGGVGRREEDGQIPALLWLLERVARRHDVHVFALHQEPEVSRYPLLGATVHNSGPGSARARTLQAILAEHRRRRFDVLHAFWASPPGVIGVLCGRLLRRPIVLHLAGGEPVALPEIAYGGARTWRGRLWAGVAVRGASRATVASGAMRDLVAGLGRTVELLPLGVDLTRWPVRPPRARDRGAPARLVHVGSLNRVKDQATLLRAAAVLRERGVAFHLDLVGVDTLNGALQRMAGVLGLSSHITFHGFLPQRRVRPLVEAADLLLLSSRHEAGPVVVLEAAVAGVPTVGTAVGHVRDWAPDAALAVSVGDWQALAQETAALLADEPRRLRIASEAQRRAVAQDADWTAGRVLALYDEVTGRLVSPT